MLPRAGGNYHPTRSVIDSITARKHPRRRWPDGTHLLAYGATRPQRRCCMRGSPDRHPSASNSPLGGRCPSGCIMSSAIAHAVWGNGALSANIRNPPSGKLRLNGIQHGQARQAKESKIPTAHNTSVNLWRDAFSIQTQDQRFCGLW